MLESTSMDEQERDPLVGNVFADKYQILSVLGRGGMSVVYKAQHKYMDRIVAVKLLLEHLVDDNVALARFQQEFKAAASLSHQNIVSVHDFGVTASGQFYFVMDCLEGESLEDIVFRDGRVELNRAVDIFRQVCEGLHHAHKKGIIHRDLKPSNIVLIREEDGSETAKIVDFGIAKIHAPDVKDNNPKQPQVRLTQTGEVFGSPLYMSPEQCQGYSLDARSDIYSLGCLMYETLTGTTPFAADSFLNMALLHVHQQPPHFSEVMETELPEAIEGVVRTCLGKEPKDRYESAEQVRQKLLDAALVSGLPGLKPGAVPLTKRESESNQPASPLRRTWENMKSAIDSKAGKKTRKTLSKMQKVVGLCAGIFLVAASFYLFYFPGAPGDRGTPFNKVIWGNDRKAAEDALERKDYIAVRRHLDSARKLCANFDDNNFRLKLTVTQQAQAYHAMGDYIAEEKANKELANILTSEINVECNDLEKKMAQMESHTSSTTKLLADRQAVLANSYNVLRIAKRLYSRTFYKRDNDLLTKAIDQFEQLQLNDATELAALKIAKAECLIAQEQLSDVRPLLVDAVNIRKPALKLAGNKALQSREKEPLRMYILSLLKLVSFDRDQNEFDDAEPELREAVKLADENLHEDSALMNLCLNSYADTLRQMARLKLGNSTELAARAKALVEKAKEFPAGDLSATVLNTDSD